jgi:Protein of unknown function (DUF1592)/Protein of unknown function (DUF1588)/Protein of unknown function (DUF1595)
MGVFPDLATTRQKLKCAPAILLVAAATACTGIIGGNAGAGSSNGPSAGSSAGGGDGHTLGTVPIQNVTDKAIARLTNAQFVHSAAALVGDAATSGVSALLPPQDIQDGLFQNTGFAQEELYSTVQGYDAAAAAIVNNITDWAGFNARFGGCAQMSCVNAFLSAFLEAAFRRPATDQDVSAFKPILDASAAAGLPYNDTVALLIRATLQAPEFLYFFFDDLLDDFQLAARLSYLINDGPPDTMLYAAAKAHQLSNQSAFDAQVDRLLAGGMTPFAQAFAFDFLTLHKAPTRNVNQTSVSTAADATTVAALMQSATDSFAALVSADQPISAVLTTDTFVVNAATATWISGQTAPAGIVKPTGIFPFMGLLTHPATLIAVSNAVFGSTVSRGQFIANQLLCIPPTPPPPPNIQQTDLSAELPPNPTARDYGVARMRDSRCAGCHTQFEPYSFALNKWGGDGLFKTDPTLKDDGPIVTGLGDLSFNGYQDFLPMVAQSTQYERCMTDHVVRYGLQHSQYPADLVDSVIAGAKSGGSVVTFRGLVKTLVHQPIFRSR